jgi:hypothetical protein
MSENFFPLRKGLGVQSLVRLQSGTYLALLANIRPVERVKLSSLLCSVTKKKIITFSPFVIVIKLFSSSLMDRPNKLECLYLQVSTDKSNICGKGQEPTPKVFSSGRVKFYS